MPSAVLTSTVKPPCTPLSNVAVTVIAPSFSLPLTSARVTAALSSLLIVTLAVSLISTEEAVPAKPDKLTLNVSLASKIESFVGLTVKVWLSPALPIKVNS